jgi:superfamily I DNA/RNA helicase
MDAKISKIQIAGAGAGKTYNLAQRVISDYLAIKDHKKIYAITYTNYASRNISDSIREQLGTIPDEVEVSTVHTFLLNEIIYPYSKLILGNSYTKAVSVPLDPKPQFKNYRLKLLNEREIIHNEQVFNKSHSILKKKGKKKAKKLKIDTVYQHLKDSIHCIMVDEAQDLDDDALNIFRLLSEIGIPVYMVGDPKQAIKYPGVFGAFVDACKTDEVGTFEILENLNSSRRLSEEHLSLSNEFCPKDQRQSADNKIKGKLTYTFVNDKNFNLLFKNVKKDMGNIYIRQSNERFLTKKSAPSIQFPNTVLDSLEKISTNRFIDFDTWVSAVLEQVLEDTQRYGAKTAINKFTTGFDLNLKNNEYAEFIQSLGHCQSKSSEYEVISIEKVKGLEADRCMFIVDNVMMSYLSKKKTEINKEHHKLYVALTRSKKELILAFDLESIKCCKKQEIEQTMESYSVKKYADVH